MKKILTKGGDIRIWGGNFIDVVEFDEQNNSLKNVGKRFGIPEDMKSCKYVLTESFGEFELYLLSTSSLQVLRDDDWKTVVNFESLNREDFISALNYSEAFLLDGPKVLFVGKEEIFLLENECFSFSFRLHSIIRGEEETKEDSFTDSYDLGDNEMDGEDTENDDDGSERNLFKIVYVGEGSVIFTNYSNKNKPPYFCHLNIETHEISRNHPMLNIPSSLCKVCLFLQFHRDSIFVLTKNNEFIEFRNSQIQRIVKLPQQSDLTLSRNIEIFDFEEQDQVVIFTYQNSSSSNYVIEIRDLNTLKSRSSGDGDKSIISRFEDVVDYEIDHFLKSRTNLQLLLIFNSSKKKKKKVVIVIDEDEEDEEEEESNDQDSDYTFEIFKTSYDSKLSDRNIFSSHHNGVEEEEEDGEGNETDEHHRKHLLSIQRGLMEYHEKVCSQIMNSIQHISRLKRVLKRATNSLLQNGEDDDEEEEELESMISILLHKEFEKKKKKKKKMVDEDEEEEEEENMNNNNNNKTRTQRKKSSSLSVERLEKSYSQTSNDGMNWSFDIFLRKQQQQTEDTNIILPFSFHNTFFAKSSCRKFGPSHLYFSVKSIHHTSNNNNLPINPPSTNDDNQYNHNLIGLHSNETEDNNHGRSNLNIGIISHSQEPEESYLIDRIHPSFEQLHFGRSRTYRPFSPDLEEIFFLAYQKFYQQEQHQNVYLVDNAKSVLEYFWFVVHKKLKFRVMKKKKKASSSKNGDERLEFESFLGNPNSTNEKKEEETNPSGRCYSFIRLETIQGDKNTVLVTIRSENLSTLENLVRCIMMNIDTNRRRSTGGGGIGSPGGGIQIVPFMLIDRWFNTLFQILDLMEKNISLKKKKKKKRDGDDDDDEDEEKRTEIIVETERLFTKILERYPFA